MMIVAPPKKRGRPPKPRLASHKVLVSGPDGRLRFETRAGPRPPRRPGRPTGPSRPAMAAMWCSLLRRPATGAELQRDAVLRTISDEKKQLIAGLRATLRALTTIERDEALCVAVAEQLETGCSVRNALMRVAREHAVSLETARAAYYAHRDRLEWAED